MQNVSAFELLLCEIQQLLLIWRCSDVPSYTRLICIFTKIISTSGVRTHADIRPLELKSNALTTRPKKGDKGLPGGRWKGGKRGEKKKEGKKKKKGGKNAKFTEKNVFWCKIPIFWPFLNEKKFENHLFVDIFAKKWLIYKAILA